MAEAQTHVFRVSLSPKVYRDFEILSAKNLYDLAGEIVRVLGFDPACCSVPSLRPRCHSSRLGSWIIVMVLVRLLLDN